MRSDLLIIRPTILLVFLVILLMACNQSTVKQRKEVTKTNSKANADSALIQVEKDTVAPKKEQKKTFKAPHLKADNLELSDSLIQATYKKVNINNPLNNYPVIRVDTKDQYLSIGTEGSRFLIFSGGHKDIVPTHSGEEFYDSTYAIKLQFYSLDRQQKLGEYDIRANCPFNEDLYPNIRFNRGMRDELPSSMNLARMDTTSYEQIIALADEFYTKVDIININDNFIGVVYNLSPIDTMGKEMGVYSTVVVLDSTGQRVFYEATQKHVRDIHVTPNKKYVAYTYGGDWSDFGNFPVSISGVRIYDRQSMKIIHQGESDDPAKIYMGVGNPSIGSKIPVNGRENWISISIDKVLYLHKDPRGLGYQIFNTDDQVFYERFFLDEERPSTKMRLRKFKGMLYWLEEFEWEKKKFNTLN